MVQSQMMTNSFLGVVEHVEIRTRTNQDDSDGAAIFWQGTVVNLFSVEEEGQFPVLQGRCNLRTRSIAGDVDSFCYAARNKCSRLFFVPGAVINFIRIVSYYVASHPRYIGCAPPC